MNIIFIKAFAVTILLCLGLSALGVIASWKRLSYYGDGLSHASLLGIAFSLIYQIDMTFAIIAVSLLFAVLIYLQDIFDDKNIIIASTTYGFLALSLILISLAKIDVDLEEYLFGDIFLLNNIDVVLAVAIFFVAIIIIQRHFKNFLLLSISEDIAYAKKINVPFLKAVYLIILSIILSLSIKILGVMLATAILVIPAQCARYFSKNPMQMFMQTVIFALASSIIGLYLAFEYDLPSGPAIVMPAFTLQILALVYKKTLQKG